MTRPTLRAHSVAFLILVLSACGGGDAMVGPAGPGGTPGGAVATKWSDPATWGGTVPAANGNVVIPQDKTVVLDVSPPPLAKLTVQGKLVFGDVDLALTAGSIIVNGALQAGTESQPYTKRAVITLTGTDSTIKTDPFGAKVLGVAGTIDLHGETRVTWVRLGATAPLGATTLTLERDPQWRAGERIVVASTDFNPDWSEDATITAVSGATLTIDKALQWKHYGERQTIAGTVVDERAEVALLSRNITIRSDSAPNGFGGHLMILRGATARIEGVEVYQMGQKHAQGRYPIHWHLAGSVAGQYIKNSAVWKTNNRCYTVHGTNDLLLDSNVCYDHPGHGYFLEDGAETGNTLRNNIGLRTRVPATADRLLGSDARAATFWITNPDNSFTGNVAAGSERIGFWVALPAAPTGLSTGVVAYPRRTPLRQFDGNVAHSNRDTGLNVDDGPKPDFTTETTSYAARVNPADGSSAIVPVTFRDFVAWKNAGNAIWSRGTQHVYTNAILADNRIGATFPSNESVLRGATVIGETANQTTNSALSTSAFILGFEFYDGRVATENSTFANFQPSGARSVGALGIKLNNSFSINPANYALGATFVNANVVALQTPAAGRDGNKMAVLYDSTGSVTGTAGRFVVANQPMLYTSACTQRTDWNAWICPLRYLNLSIRSGTSGESVNPLTITRDDAVATSLVGIGNDGTTMTNTGANMNLVTGRTYTIAWSGTVPTKPYFTMTRAWVGDAVTLIVPYPVGTINVFRNYNRSASIAAAASAAEVDAAAGDKFWYDAVNKAVYLKFVASSANEYGNTLFIEPK